MIQFDGRIFFKMGWFNHRLEKGWLGRPRLSMAVFFERSVPFWLVVIFTIVCNIWQLYIYIYCNIVVWFSFNLGACFSEMLKRFFGDNMPWDAVPPSNSDTWRLWSCDPLTKHAIPCPETNSMSLKNGWFSNITVVSFWGGVPGLFPGGVKTVSFSY